jgi:hypothetical protein
VKRLRIFVAGLVAVVACAVILMATFVNQELLGLATAMVPLLTALCTGLLTTEYFERRAQVKPTEEGTGG